MRLLAFRGRLLPWSARANGRRCASSGELRPSVPAEQRVRKCAVWGEPEAVDAGQNVVQVGGLSATSSSSCLPVTALDSPAALPSPAAPGEPRWPARAPNKLQSREGEQP